MAERPDGADLEEQARLNRLSPMYILKPEDVDWLGQIYRFLEHKDFDRGEAFTRLGEVITALGGDLP